MTRRRLMVGKEYKFIKNAQKLTITNVVSQDNIVNAGALFNNYTSGSSNFSVYFTVRVNADNSNYDLVSNKVDDSNYWEVATSNGYLVYTEVFEGKKNTVNFSSLGKIEKGKWYNVNLYLPNAEEAYCKINSDTYTKFTTGTRRRLASSKVRAVYFGRNGDYGVDFRGELTLKGFSSNGTTRNVGTWNIDDMSLGNDRYMNGSGGTPSSLRLSVMNSSVCMGRE